MIRLRPLATALDKLEAVLGASDVVDVTIGEGTGVEELRRAAADRRRLRIDYYSFGRDVMTHRTVDPYGVVSLRGNWYLAAYCHQAQDDRLFRVDRIRAVQPTDATFEARADATLPEEVFVAQAEHTRVTLSLPPSAAWVTEAYPTESVEEKRGGRLRVVLMVAARPWLERLLLQAGPEAKVIAPKAWRLTGAEAGRRLLSIYRA